MTNENYTHLSNEMLIEQFNAFHIPAKYFRHHLNKGEFIDLFNEIKCRTNFLDEVYEHIPISMRLYCISHNMQECPKCKNPNCDNKTPIKWIKSLARFRDYCSCKCSITDESTQNKIKETCIKNLGVANPMQSKEIQEKSRQTLFKHYNVYSPIQSIEIQKRFEQTSIANNGVSHPWKSPKIRKQIKETNLKRLGVEHPGQSKVVQKKMQDTNEKRYGVKFAAQSQEIKNKTANTNLQRHGVKWYPQSDEYHKKAHKRYTNPKYPGMTFGSSWEFIVYDFLLENHINFEYQPTVSFPYEYKGTHHTYHPDFLIDGKVYEVKGEQFFRINESSGQKEMFCPYRDKDWTDEKYNWMCGLYEAKHQCMISNGIIILSENEINNLSNILV